MSNPTRPARLLDLAAALPDHLELAIEATSHLPTLPSPTGLTSIVVLGMGSGRTAGRALAAIAGPRIALPILVESSYAVPAWVGAGSLVFAVSGSGNTDEVNYAAAQAAELGARVVAITAAGWLADFARDRGATFIAIPREIEPARTAFGFTVAALISVLVQMGLLLPEATAWISSAAAHLRRRRSQIESEAAKLATGLVDRHVTFQGDARIGAVAAERWKAQFNQNARQPASFSEQPNASHNEVVAWDALRREQVLNETVVLLRHPFEDARVAQRLDQFAAYLNGKAPVHQIRGEGDTPLAALLDLTMMADFTSLAVAAERGVDPSSIPFITTTLKEGIVPPEYHSRDSK